MFDSLNSNNIWETLNAAVIEYGFLLIKALLVLVIGLWLSKKITGFFKSFLEKKDFDKTIIPFLSSILGMVLKAMVVISAISIMGIPMTSFIAILGAAGLAIGMALSGTLQNFAGGVMILIFKPFEVGHVIEAQGYTGSVREIQIFNTILKTPDNKTIIIPNGGLSTGSLVNYSIEPRRRVDWTVGIAYGDDVDTARAVIEKMLLADERVLTEEGFKHVIVVGALADSSVNFTVRAWVNAADYWGLFFDINEKIYKTFPNEGLNIPFPQMDVHVHQESK